jgi:hypothetical protein
MEINLASISWICKPFPLNDLCKHRLTYPTVAAVVGGLALCFLAASVPIRAYAKERDLEVLIMRMKSKAIIIRCCRERTDPE